MGRKVGLTRVDVVEEAARIADAEGVEAVTMASVANRLGVRSPSLYVHVSGLDGLRRLLALRAADSIARALRDAAADRRGIGGLWAIARAYRRFAREHPGLYAAAQRAVRPGEDDELYHALAGAVTPVLRALAEVGVPETERIHVARAFRSALHGFVALEGAGGFGMPEAVDESFDRMVELLIAGLREVSAVSGPFPESRGEHSLL